MKSQLKVLITSIFLWVPLLGMAQCPTAITFSSQQEIDDFLSMYPGCTTISGDVIISGNDIVNLNGLMNIENVGGHLVIMTNPSLTSLTGLNNIASIGGSLDISDNFSLPNLNELSNIENIGGNLKIASNSSLTGLIGLNNLENIGGFFQISGNPLLNNVNELSNLESIGGYLYIESNTQLNDITGLQNIDSSTIGGLDGLTIINNPNLSVCSLPNLCVYLSDPANPRTISGNASYCLDETAVLASCEPCEIPDTLGVEDVHISTVTLTWESDDDLFDIEWGKAGFTQGNGTLVTGITDEFYKLSGLDADTAYEFYVRTQCGFKKSPWAGSTSFTTLKECPTGYITISSQQQIDDFGSMYGHCNTLYGSLWITGDSITNLNGLNHLEKLEGYLHIDSGSLTNLNGLNNLEYISNYLYINSKSLITLDGLDNLQTIDGYLVIRDNPLLTSLEGLSSLTNLGGRLEITDNFSLTSLVGLNALENLNNEIYINNNASLTTLDGLDNITTIGGHLDIMGNPLLMNLNGLSKLKSIGNHLSITYNSSLINIDGLNSLESIGKMLFIGFNSSLTNLDGLSSLESIGGNLQISNNDLLNDISGLQHIDPSSIGGFDGLTITNNPNLSVCNLPNLCIYLSDPANPRTISDNATDCFDETVVAASCASCQIPNTLDVEDLFRTTVTLTWESDDDLFDIEWGTAGFTQGNGTLVTGITDKFYNLSGLDADTDYEFYVRTQCGSEKSPWAGPTSFTTLDECPTGYVVFETQQQIDDFLINYPGCTTISGDIIINGNDIVNLNGLSNITNIGGHLAIIYNPSLVSLTGLDNVVSIDGVLSIGLNEFLTSFVGLDNLQNIGGDFGIISNPSLTSFAGLDNIESIGGALYIEDNIQLNDITGLQNIDPSTIGGLEGLYIVDNPNLSVCYLPNFCMYLSDAANPRTISGNATDCLDETAVLASCEPCEIPDNLGVENLHSTSVTLTWESDDDLFDIEWGTAGFTQGNGTMVTGITDEFYKLSGLDADTDYEFYVRTQCGFKKSPWAGSTSFTTLKECPPGDFHFFTQQEVNDFGMMYGHCTSIPGNVTIFGSYVTNLDGLSGLESIGGDVTIQSTSSLDSLSGLNNLKYIGGSLVLSSNSSLTAIELNNLESIGGNLTIKNNNALFNINGLNQLENIGGNFEISNNYALSDITALINLNSIGGELNILKNLSLITLSGLNNLDSIGAHLHIQNNASLEDISALQNLNPLTISGAVGLKIVDNSKLSICDLSNFCVYLSNPANPRTISGNAGTCISDTDLIFKCFPCDTPENLSINDLHSTTVTLTWESDDDLFDIEWGTVGFTQGTGTIVSGIPDEFYALSGLLPDTDYEFYVRANCGVTQSEWTGPFVFKTLRECPTINQSFYTQQQIDEFGVNYSHCSVISGNVTITGNDIINLDGLSAVEIIEGYLHIHNNTLLSNLSGLNDLSNIKGGLYVYNNSSLIQFGGLNNLENLEGDLFISLNSALTTLNGLYSLESINGNIDIYSNPYLADIQGLGSLKNIHGSLNVYNNPSLISFDGFNSLKSIGNHLDVSSNDSLTSFDGLHNLSSLGGNLFVQFNQELTDVNGLIGLENVGGSIIIIQNTLLNDISGVQNIDPSTISGTGLVISNNPALFVCDLPNFCDYLSNPANPRLIIGNAGDCINEAVVISKCFPCEAPENLDVSGIYGNSATLVWSSTDALFDVQWGTAGFAQGNGTTVTGITDEFYKLSGLDADTDYEFYVRTNCGVTQSEWEGPFGFRTSSNDFIYQNGVWSPGDPSGIAIQTDNILVINGSTALTTDTEVYNLIIMPEAHLKIEGVLTLFGDMIIDGDLTFVSAPTTQGELAAVSPTSTITGEVTVEHFMKDRRSYRMVSSAVTTTTSIHDNWQEGAVSRSDNPNPGYGTHITGTTIDQTNGFDGTQTGNASMFTIDVPSQTFQAIANTDVNTLTAGDAYLMFIRGDRTLSNIDTPDGHTATTLRARGQLVTGNQMQAYPTTTAGQFVMFGNPYQSAVDINDVFANSTNVNTNQYYVYDVNIGDYGNYVTVNLPGGTNPSGSSANQYLQAGQAAQFATLSNGPTVLNFMESDKAPGNYTSNNAGANGLMSGNILNIQLYTAKNFNEGGSVHDGMAILFDAQYSNNITATDAPKAFGFGENIAIDHNGTYLSIERREMPVAGEVYSLYTAGYNHQDYVFKIDLEGVTDVMLYLDDNYTGTSTLLQAGVNTYSFEVSDELSQASDRFSIRTESLLNVDDPTSFAGVRLYPNPLNAETFYVHAPMLNGKEVEIRIADISGRQIYNRTLQSTSDRIEVSVNDTLSSGVYLVTIKHAGEFKTYRLIRE